MFREMRRGNQALTQEENIAILERGTSGVLAMIGDAGYPYALPISYVYHDGKLYFHGAKAGHKIDAIVRNEKVSFCVIDQDNVVPEAYTTHYRSVIAFGKARILEGEAEKKAALEVLLAKYSRGHEEGRLREMDKMLGQTCVIELEIAHMTGKEHLEMMKAKRAK